jgi:pimeloyl-ACP methyl ester carboxylesterase
VRLHGREVLVRVSEPVEGATPLVHVHGFAISGRSLMPTAERLTGFAMNVVPDLPGYGGSERWDHTLSLPELAGVLADVLAELRLGRVVLLGNSMGCAICLRVAYAHPELVERLIMVSPAGGVQNQPFSRALGQLARDAPRESPRMAPIAVSDYVRFGPVSTLTLFAELTRFPTIERFVELRTPALAVFGSRDPLAPPPARVAELARMGPDNVTVVLIEGAAHAANFSHPGELAHVVRSWLRDEEIVDNPDEPGYTRVLRLGRRGRPA